MNKLLGGFLIRPLLIALVFGSLGPFVGVGRTLSWSQCLSWVPTVLFPSNQDPQVAQIILSSIATSMMTVVSIVFAILFMPLTLV